MDIIKKNQQKIYENLGFIFVFIVVLVYVAWGFATITTTEKTILEIIADTAISLTLGLSISVLLKMQGLIWGEMDEKFAGTVGLYGQTLERAVPHFYKLADFTDYKNKTAVIITRHNILQAVGLVYKDYYNDEGKFIGKYIDDELLDEGFIAKQNAAIDSSLNLKITYLSPSDLTSDTGKREVYSDPNDLGPTKEQHMKKGTVMQFLMKLVLAFVFGYFALEMLQDLSKANIIWKVVQVTTFTLSGFIQLYKAYIFITNDYRNSLIKKTNLLDEMIAWEK